VTVTDIAIPTAVSDFLRTAEESIVIGGKRQTARSGATIDTYDPATGAVIAKIAAGGEADIDDAVRSARSAFEERWRPMSPSARGRCLLTLADLIESNLEDLAALETLDNGKPVTESMYVDLAYAAEVYRYYGGWVTKIAGDVLPVSPTIGSAFAYTRREPLGVVGAIVPWNFPMLMTSWKLGAALAAGNTVVLKPSEFTSLSAIRLAELALEAGFPPGVLNVVTGDGANAGGPLSAHPDVNKVTFTGSTATGRKILAASVGNLKQVTLELGGKSPNIVFPDADLDSAVQGLLLGIFMNQGQVCCAGTRAFVHESVHDEVVDRLAKAAESITLGHGLADGTDMGPLVSSIQCERVLGYIDSGRSGGATVVTGGERAGGDLSDGYFVRPTIFADVNDDMEIAREEIFGPVLSVLRFSDEAEVVARANASRYGLAAGVWTTNLPRAHRVAAQLEAGTVWVNTYNMIDPTAPFGGCKDSGFGRDLGVDALNSYMHTKSVWIGLD
jgi:aldehyde dehydrogenase (NAD+)/phenylacetaldehyde dehydrogenase